MEYDENKVLTDYICKYETQQMTEFESIVLQADLTRFKAKNSSELMARTLMERWGHENNELVNTALAKGIDQFRESIKNRIIKDNPKLIINRCPSCNKVVRTPKAKQCNWCLESWHEKT